MNPRTLRETRHACHLLRRRPAPAGRSGQFRPEQRLATRAAGVQQPARRHRAVRGDHRGAGLPGRDAADAERQLRAHAAGQPPLHQELPGKPQRVARAGQLAAHRGREPERRHLRPEVPRDAAQDQRRAGADAGRRPRLGQVAVVAGGALDRSHRRGLSRRPGDARQLRRLGTGDRAAARQHRALGAGRQPGRQQLQVEHDRRAAARQGPEDRPAHRLPHAVVGHRSHPRQVRSRWRRQGAGGAHARDRLRQAGRRPDRRPVPRRAVLRLRRGRRRSHHLLLHPLRAQHRAGAGLFAGGGAVAAGPGGGLRLRDRPLFDPGALPGVRHRRVARRAEDERHHAGHRQGRAPAGRRALHLPPPVPGRGDGAAGRRGGLRGADDDRHPGDPGPGADRQHRRGGADPDQPDPAAGAAVVHRRQRGRRRAQPARRQRRELRPRRQQNVGAAGALHRAALGHRRGGRQRAAAGCSAWSPAST